MLIYIFLLMEKAVQKVWRFQEPGLNWATLLIQSSLVQRATLLEQWTSLVGYDFVDGYKCTIF